MINGKEYVVIVRATNMVGLSVDARSDGFRVDSTAPISGNIWILKPQGKRDYNKISARYCITYFMGKVWSIVGCLIVHAVNRFCG